MNQLKGQLGALFNYIRFKKFDLLKLIGLFVLLLLLFTILMFPFSDLNDYITRQIYKNSGKMVYAQFESVDIGFLPFPYFEASEVMINSKAFPSVKASKLFISPSPMDISNIAFKNIPSLSEARIEGFLDSEIEASLSLEGETEEGSPRHKVRLEIQNLNLKGLQPFLSLPFNLEGEANLNLDSLITMDLSEQPDGDLALTSKKLVFPSFTVPTAIGAITLPTLSFSKVNIKGRMSDSRLYIEEMTLGDTKDQLRLKVKGDSGFYFKKARRSSTVVIENFKIKIQLDVSPELQSTLYFISFLDEFKQQSSDGYGRYLFRVSGRSMQDPDLSKLSSF